jgi:hypothetical protein
MARKLALALLGAAALAVAVLWLLGSGRLGRHHGAGVPTAATIPAEVVAERARAERAAASEAGVAGPKQVLFGDLHVHTTFSTDAFLMSLPTAGGQGPHPVSDACDFARFCSSLDFWSINDHALALTPERWRETVLAMRNCDAVAGGGADPDVAAFLGWEWTQVGRTPADHYGHKNVVLRHLDDARIPTRPIDAGLGAIEEGDRPSTLAMGLLPLLAPGRDSLDLVRYFQEGLAVPACPSGVPVRELPADCADRAATPGELFAKLDEWGHEALVIPHGTTWGFYTPAGSSWDKQLDPKQHDPERQTLIEVYSGHGNSEEFRAWREVELAEGGARRCPEPTDAYLPSCWRAGELIRARCTEAGEPEAECDRRAAEARQHAVDADLQGFLTVPGARPEEWLDAGQCRDCFLPAFNYRPRSSVQYILALRSFADPRAPLRFRFGMIASSDNHSARPGTGYKEFGRSEMTEARFGSFATGILGGRPERERVARSEPRSPEAGGMNFFGVRETERQASFFLTGGLVGVHASGRSRDAVWEALERREVYGTSGPRILLWFDLANAPDGPLPMGSEVRLGEAPRFTVRAVGSFEQAPGCPEFSVSALGAPRVAQLCGGECYHPTDLRRRIARIEVVRIRPQARPGEPVDALIEDPWRVFACAPDRRGCTVELSDPDFAASGRDALYYARAIEEPGEAVNAGGLRCERDAQGRCIETRACDGVPASDDCLAPVEERAWSSPIFVEHAEAPLQ